MEIVWAQNTKAKSISLRCERRSYTVTIIHVGGSRYEVGLSWNDGRYFEPRPAPSLDVAMQAAAMLIEEIEECERPDLPPPPALRLVK